MAFITCSQFNKRTMKAESALLECAEKTTGVIHNPACDGDEGSVITVDKIKAAIAGDVKVNVDPNSGITGDGTANNPLGLDLSKILNLLKNGGLLGDGLDIVDGKLVVKTHEVYNSTGETLQFYTVEK